MTRAEAVNRARKILERSNKKELAPEFDFHDTAAIATLIETTIDFLTPRTPPRRPGRIIRSFGPNEDL
jgi:hypothetical protein